MHKDILDKIYKISDGRLGKGMPMDSKLENFARWLGKRHADIALAIDSNRGNEKEIARAIKADVM